MNPLIVKERLSTGHWTPPWLRHQHEARYDWAAQRAANRRVLDAACANGYGSVVLARHGASLVMAVDVALEPLAESPPPSESVRMACASVTDLPFPDGAFDLIVSLETVEHVQNDAMYVSEMRRVLAADGVLICSTPNRRVLNPGRTLADAPFNRFHVREYTAVELESLLRRGFETVELYGQSAYRERYVSLLERIGRRLPMTAVRLHQFRKLAGIAFERRARHEPRALPFPGAEPEVLIAIAGGG